MVVIRSPVAAIGRALFPLAFRVWRLLPQPVRQMLEPLACRVETWLRIIPLAVRWENAAVSRETHTLVTVKPPVTSLPGAPARPATGTPTVSVIVAAHDDGAYLDTCLLSVLQQSFGSWECIVVDDASVDDTLAVALRYAELDGRFRVVRQDRNLGPSAARNAGIARAQGRFVAMLDGDDFLFQNGLLSRYRLLAEARDPTVAGSWCDWKPVSAGAGLDCAVPTRGRSGVLDYASGRGENQTPVTSPMLRVEVARSLGGFDTSFPSAEDYDFWIRLFRNGFTLVGTGRVGVAYRQKRVSLVSDNPQLHIQNVRRVYDYLARPLESAAVCALAPHPLIEPVDGIPDPEVFMSRLVKYLTYAVLTGDQRQIDGIREFLDVAAPNRDLIRRAVMNALRRHGYRVGGLTRAEKSRILRKMSSIVAERHDDSPPPPVRHRGTIDLSRVALDAPNSRHAGGVRRREMRAVCGRAPWDVILDPTSAADAGDLLTLGRELVESGRSVAMLSHDGDAEARRRARAEGIRTVGPPTGPIRLTITSSPRPPRVAAARCLAICAEPWVPFADSAFRPDATIVRCVWEAGQRADLPNLHIGGWLARAPRLATSGCRADTVLVLRVPADTEGPDAADFRRHHGDTFDFVFGPGFDTAPGVFVAATRIPVVMPRVRAAVVVGSAVPMDAIAAGTPVIIIGAPPHHAPDGIAFTSLDQLGEAIRAARPSRPESAPADWLDRQLRIVAKYLQ